MHSVIIILFISPSHAIDINDFNEVFKYCHSVRAEWKTLASYLGVDRPTVEAIEKDEVGKVAECLQSLISAWLKRSSPTQPQPSWRLLCNAMSHLDALLSGDEHKCKCSLCTTGKHSIWISMRLRLMIGYI